MCAWQVGALPPGGNGVPLTTASPLSLSDLHEQMGGIGERLLAKLKTDTHADSLLQAGEADALLGRMTAPRKLQFEELSSSLFSPRFGIEKGAGLSCAFFVARFAFVYEVATATGL